MIRLVNGQAPLCTRLDYDGDGSEPCSRCGSKLWHHPLPDPIPGATCQHVVRGEWRFCGKPACAQLTLGGGLLTQLYCWDCVSRLAECQLSRLGAPEAFFPSLGRVFKVTPHHAAFEGDPRATFQFFANREQRGA